MRDSLPADSIPQPATNTHRSDFGEDASGSGSSALLAAALEYAALGYPVFPLHGFDGTACTCREGRACGGTAGKHPRTANGFHDATTDADQIRAWWTEFPLSNIGIRLRNTAALVTDLDCKNGQDGFTTWHALTCEIELPATPQAVTPSGGVHYLWDISAYGELKRGNDTLGPGIDTPNYVVAPPSRTPKGPYVWAQDRSPSDVVVASLPKSLAAALGTPEAPTPLPTEGPAAWADGEYSEYTKRGLRYAEENGSRVKGAFKLAGYCRDSARLEEPVALAVVQTFIDVANRVMPKDHSVTQSEAAIQVRNAYKIPRRDPLNGGLRVLNFNGAEETPRPTFVVRSRDQLKLLPKPEWLVRGILLRQGLSFIGGDSGTGKTFLALDIALCIAHGIAWNGHGVRQGPVIYIAGEDVEGLDGRITAWEQVHGVTDSPNFYYLDTAPQLLDRSQVLEVIAAIDTLELSAPPVIIFLDTLATSLVGVEENSAKETGTAMAAVKLLPDRFGCQTVMLHHTPKNGSGLRGSGAFRASANTIIEVSKEEESSVLLVRNTKQKNGATPFKPFNLTFRTVVLDEVEDISTSVLVGSAGPLVIPAKQNRVGQAKVSGKDLMQCLVNGMTNKEWLDAVVARFGIGASTFQRHLQKLVADREVFYTRELGYHRLTIIFAEEDTDVVS